MARRLHQTMADYVVIAISPALIMALVGSLVFVLLRVFYQGQFEGRLHWVMACFVFAAVLIGRISIEEGMERAMMFGVALAVPVGIAANRFMEFHGGWIEHVAWLINWGLIGLIWWCTHRLVWDCTMIDDEEDSSGEGLLQTAGLERRPGSGEKQAASSRTIEGTTSREVPAGWWQRYVERQRRPHAPGVWVVYFSLAALPLFGIGQWFIPATDQGGRRYAFWLLSVYVGSGMGLLLTTSFLGLRRYLRQRRIEMPTLMANVWMTMGAAVILVLLVFAALLPRPSAEYEISQLPISLGSPEIKSSPMAPIHQEGTHDEQPGSAPERQPPDESKPDEPKPDAAPTETDSNDQAPSPSKQPPAPNANGTPQPSGSQPSSASGDQKGGSKSSEKGQAEKSSRQQKSDYRSQPPQDKSPSSEPEKPAPLSEAQARVKKALDDQQQQRAEQQRAQQQQAQQEQLKQQQQDAAQQEKKARQEQPSGEEKQAQQQPQPAPPKDAEQQQQPNEANPELQAPESLIETATSTLALIFKWAFYGAVVLAAAYLLWRSRAEVLAAIREFLAALRDFWNGLWGLKRPRASAVVAADIPIEFPPAPFSTYADPFATGIAGRYSTEELVRYSFEAFEAWAREHGCPREIDTTPHELARDVAKRNAHITSDARNMAELYGLVAYAEGDLPANSSEQLRHLWQTMRA